jgi:hypothetical protein
MNNIATKTEELNIDKVSFCIVEMHSVDDNKMLTYVIKIVY